MNSAAPVTTVSASSGLRGDILRVAKELFSEQGYSGTSIRQVVERCGCTKPALYYYFKSKEGLFREVIRLEMDSITNLIRSYTHAPGTTRERLIGSLEVFIDHMNANHCGMRLLQRLEVHPEEGAPVIDVECSRELHMSMVEEVVRQGVETGEIRDDVDPAECAMVLVGTLSFQFQLHASNEPLCRDRIVRTIGLIFDGIASR